MKIEYNSTSYQRDSFSNFLNTADRYSHNELLLLGSSQGILPGKRAFDVGTPDWSPRSAFLYLACTFDFSSCCTYFWKTYSHVVRVCNTKLREKYFSTVQCWIRGPHHPWTADPPLELCFELLAPPCMETGGGLSTTASYPWCWGSI